MDMDHYYREKNERKTMVAELYSMGEAVKRSNVYRSELNEIPRDEVDSLLERIRKLYIEINSENYSKNRNKDYEEDIKDYRAELDGIISKFKVDINNPRTWSEWWEFKHRDHKGGKRVSVNPGSRKHVRRSGAYLRAVFRKSNQSKSKKSKKVSLQKGLAPKRSPKKVSV